MGYVFVIGLAARFLRPKGMSFVAIGCAGLEDSGILVDHREGLSSTNEGHRLLTTKADDGDEVTPAVRDSGIGLEPASDGRISYPFITARTDGVEVGHSTRRFSIGAHHRRILVAAESTSGIVLLALLPHRGALS